MRTRQNATSFLFEVVAIEGKKFPRKRVARGSHARQVGPHKTSGKPQAHIAIIAEVGGCMTAGVSIPKGRHIHCKDAEYQEVGLGDEVDGNDTKTGRKASFRYETTGFRNVICPF